MPNIIAVICDCDDTLAPDTTSWLLKQVGISDPEEEYWSKRANELVRQGWNPILAYMYLMILDVKEGRIELITEDKFKELGPKLEFFPGIPELFQKLKEIFINEGKYVEYGITLEFYVITSGLRQLISETKIAKQLTDFWGSEFDYDEAGVINFPKLVISFTEKTRFVFNINKGLIGPEYLFRPFHVNANVRTEDRRVPFKNMLYLGDGPTDIPCLSLINLLGGISIGVGDLVNGKYGKAYELGFGRRCNFIIDADYSYGSKSFNTLEKVIRTIADRIIIEEELKEHKLGHFPERR